MNELFRKIKRFLCFEILFHCTNNSFSVLGDSQGGNQIPVESVTNAYVQMVNRGNINGPTSSDSQAPTLRTAPIPGQTIRYVP